MPASVAPGGSTGDGVDAAQADSAPGWQVFVPPSDEARWWMARAPGVLAPRGSGAGVGWHLRDLVIAPFTQLTFISFPLQAFLFSVLHRSVAARVGHFVGMTLVTLGLMTAAAQVTASITGVDGAALLAGALLCWYAAISRDARLAAWWFVMVPFVGMLYLSAHALVEAVEGAAYGALAPWALLLVAGMVTAASHAFETHVPPRTYDSRRWRRTAEVTFGDRRGPAPWRELPWRLLRAGWFFVLGTANELWASPRLLPYNVLFLMMDLGYAPAMRQRIDDWTSRAWASGDPALDFVGVGGGITLDEVEVEGSWV